MKFRSHRNTIRIATAALLWMAGIASSFAQWILVDDFESYEPGMYTRDAHNLVYPVASNPGMGEMDIIQDIDGIGGANAAWFWYGISEGSADVWHQLPLPQEIPLGGSGTVFFRHWQNSLDLNWNVMVSRVPAGDEPDLTAIWGHMAAILRYTSGATPLSVMARDSGAYVAEQPVFTPQLETWYAYWIVLHNDPGVAGRYEVYRQGPEDDKPVRIVWGQAPGEASLQFRNKDQDSLKTLVLSQNAQTTPNIWLIDDIYFSPEPNLSTPEYHGSWCQWLMNSTPYDVWTGSFMGWLHVLDGPPPCYAFSYHLRKWVFVDSCPDAGGSWVYVPAN